MTRARLLASSVPCAVCQAPQSFVGVALNGLPADVPACETCRQAVKDREVGVVKRPDGSLYVTDGREECHGEMEPAGVDRNAVSAADHAASRDSRALAEVGRSVGVAMNWTIHCGDALTVLKALPDQSVHCVVTSPPYFALRDYGVPGRVGLEDSPELFAASLVAVFQGVWRVLRDDGVLWLNLGDTYAGGGNYRGITDRNVLSEKQASNRGATGASQLVGALGKDVGVASKNLIGVPWRVAFALQADGWYLRSDVIWAKPNPMPESVKDRPTKAHEYVFLLTKSAQYFYDAEAIAEKATDAMRVQVEQGYQGTGGKDYDSAGVQNPSSVKARIIENARKRGAVSQHKQQALGQNTSGYLGTNEYFLTRNARTVWQIPTEASPYDHFAVMPRALARKCILAGCPRDGVVLDPFAGAGTTLVTALSLGRSAIGIELNPKYVAMAERRIRETFPLFADGWRAGQHDADPHVRRGALPDGARGLEVGDSQASRSACPDPDGEQGSLVGLAHE